MRGLTELGLLVALCGGLGCKAQAAEPVAKLTATELAAQYKSNEVGADQKYKGKRLRVAGHVELVERTVFGDAVVQFKEGDVRAEIAKNAETGAGELEAGKAALLECTGRGLVLGAPRLDECRVVLARKGDAGA